MAVDASLELKLGDFSNNIWEIIKLFNEIGWSYQKENNKVEYIPLHDNDFNWEERVLSSEELEKIVTEKQKNYEIVILNLYRKKGEEGITFIARNPNEILLGLNINRKRIDENNFYSETDVTWYVVHIIRKLKEAGCLIYGFQFQEY